MDRIAALRAALRVRTEEQNRAGLVEWRGFLASCFPSTHATLRHEFHNTYALAYRWEPRGDASDAPILLAAHYDVVPAPETGWSVPPYAGEVRDGYAYGRGAIDDKLSHVSIMIAVEELVREGWAPTRPVYLAFGGDEEVGGTRGAVQMAERFAARGIRFALTLDEGAAVVRGMMPGLVGPVGLIGCAEKGHVNVVVTLKTRPGHAATPPRPDSSYELARVLAQLRPFPIRVPETTRAFIRALGSVVAGRTGLFLRRYPLTAPLVHRLLSRRAETDAMIRSTLALTMIEWSDTPNVLPRTIKFNLNLRLMPGESIELALRRLRIALHGLPVEIELAPGPDNNEAPPESPSSGPMYRAIETSIHSVWGKIPVLPYLVTSTTDSRHYASISDAVYRFVPMELTPDDLERIHGVDERVSVADIDRAVAFYRTLLTTVAGGDR